MGAAARADDAAGHIAGCLLKVALDGVGVARVGLARILSRASPRTALAQQVPAAVKLDLDLGQARAILFERVAQFGVGLLAGKQGVLLIDERLDAIQDRFVGHRRLI